MTHPLLTIFIFVGCFCQIMKVTQVDFEFETKVDVLFDFKRQLIIVTFCRFALSILKNGSIVST